MPRTALLSLGLVFCVGCAGSRTSLVPIERAVPAGRFAAGGAGSPSTPTLPVAAPASVAAGSPAGVRHEVLPGQTLWRIAHTYGVALEDVRRANRIEDPTDLLAGTMLLIPGASELREVPPFQPTLTRESLPTAWAWPVAGGALLSPFGAQRSRRTHRGVDIRARAGQDVLSVAPGRVVFDGEMRGYGKTVIVEHDNGLSSLYAHNSRLLVETGDRVDAGQAVAHAGRSGNASGPHCHLEIREGSVPVDPLRYLAAAEGAAP